MIDILEIKKDDFDKYTKRVQINVNEVLEPVQEIISNVQKDKDKALHDYTLKFDKADITDLTVPTNLIEESINKIDPKLKEALEKAAKNIREFHSKNLDFAWSNTNNGVTLGKLQRPLKRVGCYIPGGRGAYPSTILMTVIPAKIAGVEEVICCTPPDADGNISNEILAAAYIAGVTQIYKVGGAQAIAAMTYSTETIPRVDKIVGPGNIFVTAAKKLVYGDVDIDFPAGPSELLILADKTANPKYMATEMLAQAEHDPNAASVIVTDSKDFAQKTKEYILEFIEEQPRREIIEESLEQYGYILVTETIDEAVEFTNLYAPEHLIISTEDCDKTLDEIYNAGSIFLGNLTPVAGGDYGSGTNHVLPTSGGARMYSGLSSEEFIKRPTVQKLDSTGLNTLKDMVITLAEAEGFYAHAFTFKKRVEDNED